MDKVELDSVGGDDGDTPPPFERALCWESPLRVLETQGRPIEADIFRSSEPNFIPLFPGFISKKRGFISIRRRLGTVGGRMLSPRKVG